MNDIKFSYEQDYKTKLQLQKKSGSNLILALVTAGIFVLFYNILFWGTFPIWVQLLNIALIFVIITPLSLISELNLKRLRLPVKFLIQVTIPTVIIFSLDHLYGIIFISYLFNSVIFFIFEEITIIYKKFKENK